MIEEGFFDCDATRPDRVGTRRKRVASPLRMTTFRCRAFGDVADTVTLSTSPALSRTYGT